MGKPKILQDIDIVRSELQQTAIQKADITYVNTKTQANNLSYKESYATLADLQAAYPIGDTYNHVVLADGMIYTYTTTWVSTQVLANGTGLPNYSVIPKKTSFIDIVLNKNQFDGEKRVGKYDIATGAYDSTSTSTSCNVNPIKVKPSTKYYVSDNGVAKNVVVFQYASDGTLLVYANANNFTTYANCSYINFYAGSLSDKIMISESSDLTYELYKENYILNGVAVSKNDDVYKYVDEMKTAYPLVGKKIVNFGDSILGNFQGDLSISYAISQLTGATSYNAGFGGCKMTLRPTEPDWEPFSMCKLADAISTGDWSLQQNKVNSGFTGMPTYFPATVTMLEGINFSTIDIITISYGVNDYMKGNQVENSSNLKDLNYFNGALRYSIEKILTAYPNLRIVVFTPIFAVWFDANGNVQYDSDSKYYNNSSTMTLKDFRDGVLTVCKEYHCKGVNLYDNLGLNRYNCKSFYDTTDGIHPTLEGRKKEARMMAYALVDM